MESEDVVNGEDLAHLAQSFKLVSQSLNDLRIEFGTYRSRARWRAVIAGIALTVILSVTVSMALVARSNAHVIDSINDCTQPGGQCYEEAQKRTDARLGPFRAMICDATPPERRGVYCAK